MIPASSELAATVQAGGFNGTLVADVIVDGERVLSDISLPVCELVSTRGRKIRTQGTAVIVYSDELGRSVIPKDLTSWLTPYATTLDISYLVRAGDFSEKVLQGSLKVVGVSDPVESTAVLGARLITVGSSVRLQLADRFRVTDRERFLAPGSPSQTDSVWSELGVLTGMPLARNVSDAAITREVTYQQNRLDAVQDLAALLGGIAYVNHLGQIALDADEWPAVSGELKIGADGTVVDVTPATLTDEGVYNQVVIRSHDDDQVSILAERHVEGGPLRFGGPFGRVPYFASSEFVTTFEQADAYAASLLPEVSTLPAAEFQVQCVPDPRVEVGDVWSFPYRDVALDGRVIERRLGASGPMTLRVQVVR